MRWVAMIAMVLAGTLTAQTAGPRFEVASVKPNKPSNNGVRGGCHGIDSKYSATEAASAPPLGRCVISDGRLSHMIGIAYGVSMQMIKGAQDWVIGGYERFDVQAKADDPTKYTEAQLLEMLQNLLAERFQLRFHREPVEQSGFGLVVGKNGPKLKVSKADDASMNFAQGKPRPGEPATLMARKTSMKDLADLLSVFGGGPTIDKTGLTGEYDFTLSWDETNGPALSTAVQEQLVLKLEAQKVPVSMFVIDRAAKPGEN